MIALRRLHAAAAFTAGIALAAAIYGPQRLAIVLLVIVVIILVVSGEALRVLAANPEKRP